MIIGIGSDLCDIERIEATLARHGARFTARCFTETEQRRSDRKAGRAASYAKRFAAKEACSKALGTGLRRGVFWRDMGVVNLASGQPTMKLTGGASYRLHMASADFDAFLVVEDASGKQLALDDDSGGGVKCLDAQLDFTAPANGIYNVYTAALSGTVTDPTGAVVPNVSVTATNAGTNQQRTVTSGSDDG